jgi:hypothetical protein
MNKDLIPINIRDKNREVVDRDKRTIHHKKY